MEMVTIGRMAMSLLIFLMGKADRLSQIVAGMGSNTHYQSGQLGNDVVGGFFMPDKLSINAPMTDSFSIFQ